MDADAKNTTAHTWRKRIIAQQTEAIQDLVSTAPNRRIESSPPAAECLEILIAEKPPQPIDDVTDPMG
jgi:hypothetical protein